MKALLSETRERWSEEHLATLEERGRKGTPWHVIGRELRRSAEACKEKFNTRHRVAASAPASAGTVPTRRRARQALDAAAQSTRDALAAMPARSITAEICGDPLPGRSALDQRMMQQLAPAAVTLAGMDR